MISKNTIRWASVMTVACLVIPQATVGLNVVIGKYLLEHIPIFMFLAARFFLSAVVITVGFYLSSAKWRCSTHPKGRLTGFDWMMMIAQGLCGGFLFNYFFTWGLDYTTATSAGIIGSALPAITALSAFILLHEKINKAQLFAIFLAMAGIVLIGLNNPEDLTKQDAPTGSMLGDFLVLLALFPEAWYSIIGKFMVNRVQPLASAMVANWAAVFFFVPFAAMESHSFSWSAISWFEWQLIFAGGICGLLFFWLWPLALRTTPTATAALYGGFMPIAACISAIVFLDESFYVYEGIGMVVIFFSIWVGSRKAKPQILVAKQEVA